MVGGRPAEKEPFSSAALAESYRSDLVAAARKGEAFHIASGLPVSMRRAEHDMPWYTFACSYADDAWPRVAATTRRTHAEALTAITLALLTTTRGKPDGPLLRRALCRWGFNTTRRGAPDTPNDVRAALRWVTDHTRPVSALAEPPILRAVLSSFTNRLDGKPAAPSVINRKKIVLGGALGYAVEHEILTTNPLPALKWRSPRPAHTVDKRAVVNPVQARTLLRAVAAQPGSGPRLLGYFATLYYAGLRPEEAAALTTTNLALPITGWGELHLTDARPHAGNEWTDHHGDRDQRHLKHRAVRESRTVPCPPELNRILRDHLDQFGTGDNGHLFVGARNPRELPKITAARIWTAARAEAFTPEAAAGPLARRPYDLRHAAVSTWLNAGIGPAQVAAWAGHSVDVLLRTYAHCLDGAATVHQQRLNTALGHPETTSPSAPPG